MTTARGYADKFGKWQKPEYHLAPTYDESPPPKGPFALGMILKEIKYYHRVDEDGPPVPIPESKIYSNNRLDTEEIINTSRSFGAQVVAKIFDSDVGGNVNHEAHKADSVYIKMQKLETTYFNPSEDYIQKCLELPYIATYLKLTKYKKPIYLITGLKVVWGGTRTNNYGRGSGGGAGAGLMLGPEALDLELKVEANRAKAAGSAGDTKVPYDFVLGIRLQKLCHKKQLILAGKVTAKNKPDLGKAVLLDASDAEEDEDDVLIPQPMDEEEAAAMIL
ncbi:unnamed protein product [Clonostachys rosea]|uniref:Uncharacterized protein n=1 Tax=Bionectria ochroleuca TaxID=29856 RepID=A0ABY6UBP9_BIOOC|nr:unnamed protein product [Clonostachys rosea]